METSFINTLENISMMKLATLFWRNEGEYIKSMITSIIGKLNTHVLEEGKLNIIDYLSLPISFSNRLKNVIRFMNYELFNLNEHPLICKQESWIIIDSLGWKLNGILDIKGTVAKIKNHDINIYDKFLFACHYCFEEDVEALWDEISDGLKNYFLKSFEDISLLEYWKHYFRNKLPMGVLVLNDVEDVIYSNLYYAIEKNNVSQAQYFWEKLTPESKSHFVQDLRPDDKHLFYFFYIHKIDPAFYLESVLLIGNLNFILEINVNNWLWNDNFFNLLDAYDDLLDTDNIRLLLDHIIYLMSQYPAIGELQIIFRQFWKRYKLHISNKESSEAYFLNPLFSLFNLEDIESLKLIFNELSEQQKQFAFKHIPELIPIMAEEE